ncbi:MAG: antibiotic biosynthesis monooxygenase family protein [Candidatus Acidiferrales bacterium]
MVARVTQYKIRPGKIEAFTSAVESMSPALDKFHGFRVLLVLRGPEEDSREATTISVWDSVEDLRHCDNDKFYYHAIANLMKCCESFSPMREQDVLASKFLNR